MAYAYISKMRNFLTDAHAAEHDDNPWNNKDTEDFMRHLKAEYHAIVYPAAMLAMEGAIGMPTEGLSKYGPHETNPCRIFFAICMVPRAVDLLAHLVFGWLNTNWTAPNFQTQRLVQCILNLVVFVVLLVLFLANKETWAGQNVLARVWAPMEIATKAVEVVVYLHKRFVQDRVLPPSLAVGQIHKAAEVDPAINEGGADDLVDEIGEQIDDELEHLSDQEKKDRETAVVIDGVIRNKGEMRLAEELAKKETTKFSEEDFVTLVVLCYLKGNTKELFLLPSKRAQMFWAALTAQLLVLILILCQYKAMTVVDPMEAEVAANFWVYCVKFPAMFALHFKLTPEVENGMRVMKFANQDSGQFTPSGSITSFILGFN